MNTRIRFMRSCLVWVFCALSLPENVAQSEAAFTEESFVFEASDFSFETPVFEENRLGYDVLSVQPGEAEVTGESSAVFTGDSGAYRVALYTIGENRGESAFSLFLNGMLIAEYRINRAEAEEEAGNLFNRTVEGVYLQKDDIVTVKATTASYAGDAYTRASFYRLEMEQMETAHGAFVESDGYVVIEMEHVDVLKSPWAVRKGGGSMGDGYIEFTASNSLGQPASGSDLEYLVDINTPGTYGFSWRSRNGDGAQKFDEENDSWVMIEADEYFGIENENKRVVNGIFVKNYIHSMDSWKHNGFGEIDHVTGHRLYATFDTPGRYAIHLAGRSHGHVIDRMALFLPEKESIAKANSTPESERDATGYSPGAPVISLATDRDVYKTSRPVIAMLASYVISEDPEEIVKVYFFVDGEPAGSTKDAPYQETISGLEAGTHTIRAEAHGYGMYAYAEKEIEVIEVPLHRNSPPANSLHLYPNPVGSILYFDGRVAVESFEIHDTSGRLWTDGEVHDLPAVIPVDHLPPGSYILRAVGGKGTRFVELLIKR